MVEVGDYYVFTPGDQKYIYKVVTVDDDVIQVYFIYDFCITYNYSIQGLYWSFKPNELNKSAHRKIRKEEIVGEIL